MGSYVISKFTGHLSRSLCFEQDTDMVLRVGYGMLLLLCAMSRTQSRFKVREHFSSPLLQYAADDADKTFTLVECPST